MALVEEDGSYYNYVAVVEEDVIHGDTGIILYLF